MNKRFAALAAAILSTICVGVAILASYIAIRIMGYGQFWVPEWWYNLAG